MLIVTIIVLVIIGLVSSTFGAIVGLGGGIIIVPALIYFGPSLMGEEISTATAVGTSLAVLIFTALSSTVSYAKKKLVDFRSSWLFFATSGPASMIGAALTGKMQDQLFQLVFGFFMLFMAILMIVREKMKPRSIAWRTERTYTDSNGNVTTYGYHWIPVLLIGFAVGFISGLFGIGGGSLFVPLMVLLFRYPPHVATATSMFVIFLSSILGSGMHAYYGEIDWLPVAVLAPSAYIGGKIGAYIAGRMSGNGLLWLLRITLLVLAVRMIIGGMTSA